MGLGGQATATGDTTVLITAAHQPVSTFPRWTHKPQGRWGEPAAPLKDEGWRPGGEATTRGHAGDRESQPPGDPQLPGQDGPGRRWKGKPGCWIASCHLPPREKRERNPRKQNNKQRPGEKAAAPGASTSDGGLKGAPTHPAMPGSDGEVLGVQARGERGQTWAQVLAVPLQAAPPSAREDPMHDGGPRGDTSMSDGAPRAHRPPGDVWAPWPALCKHLARSA